MTRRLVRSLKTGHYTSEERREIERLWALGWSARRIAEEIGRNGVSVGIYARERLGLFRQPPRSGVPPRQTRPVPPELADARAWVDRELEHFRRVRDGGSIEDPVRLLATYHIDILLSVKKRLEGGDGRYTRIEEGGPYESR